MDVDNNKDDASVSSAMDTEDGTTKAKIEYKQGNPRSYND